MRILQEEDIKLILAKLAEAEKEKTVGGQARAYEQIGRAYTKDLIILINALSQLVVDAQQLTVALVLQAGGEVTLQEKFLLGAKVTALHQELRIQHGRDTHISVTPLER